MKAKAKLCVNDIVRVIDTDGKLLDILAGESMTIKVGDTVTWRHGKSKATHHVPLGIAGCEVLELGTSTDGQPAAKLKLPPFFGNLPDDAYNGYVADLEKD